MSKAICGIYCVKSLDTGHAYVGLSVNIHSRFKDHAKQARRGDSNVLYRAIRKYGIDRFEFSVLEECKESELAEKEAEWVEKLQSHKDGYNMTPGGNFPPARDPVIARKISVSRTGYKTPKDVCLRMSENFKAIGIRPSPEAIALAAEHNRGRPRSAETLRKISEAHKRSWRSGNRKPSSRKLKEFCPSGHPYSGANLYVSPDGARCCRTCSRMKNLQYKQKLKMERRSRRAGTGMIQTEMQL